MSKINADKQNYISQLDASEWNSLADINNLMISAGITPDLNNVNQINKAVANYVAVSDCYTDSGIANAYVLTPINNFQAPTSYIEGMKIRFITSNANTGASTINVASLGVKTIKKFDGSDVISGDIPANVEIELVYRSGVFKINLVSSSSSVIKQAITQITIANNSTNPNTDIDFSGGNINIDGFPTAPALTKRLQSSGSWSAGAGGNMLLSGAIASNSTYHLFAIYNPTTAIADYCAMLGVAGTAPDPTSVLPAGYTKFKRVGSILTNGSGNIRAFTQFEKYFKYFSGISDLNTSFVAGSTTPTVSTPHGISTLGLFNIGLDIASSSNGNNIWSVIGDFNQTSSLGIVSISQASVNVCKIPAFTNASSASASAFTNLSSQVKIFSNETVLGTTLASISLLTLGFIDINL
jgi:hypothetical protein